MRKDEGYVWREVPCRSCKNVANHTQHKNELYVVCGACGTAWEKDAAFHVMENGGQTFLKIFSKSRDLASLVEIVKTAEELGTPGETLIEPLDHGYSIDIPMEAVATRLQFAHLADSVRL
jgi:hypothetical protein